MDRTCQGYTAPISTEIQTSTQEKAVLSKNGWVYVLVRARVRHVSKIACKRSLRFTTDNQISIAFSYSSRASSNSSFLSCNYGRLNVKINTNIVNVTRELYRFSYTCLRMYFVSGSHFQHICENRKILLDALTLASA